MTEALRLCIPMRSLVGTSELKNLEDPIHDLERMIGSTAMKVEILRKIRL